MALSAMITASNTFCRKASSPDLALAQSMLSKPACVWPHARYLACSRHFVPPSVASSAAQPVVSGLQKLSAGASAFIEKHGISVVT